MRWTTDQWRSIGAGVVLVAAGLAVYANSFSGPFVFDDVPGIVENPSIRSLWPLSGPLIPPGGGNALAGRPVANLTFALNHAADGLEVWGYHLVNLLIHAVAGLVLFGVVRRTLQLAHMPEWLRSAAWSVGLSTALLWLVHPLQTESVTFIVQRTESLAGLFYLLALYGFIRGTEEGAANSRAWLGLGAAAVWFGVATKETVATAPLMILLYDRAFVARSFREAWRRHAKVHAAMALAWLLLAWLMSQTGGRGGTVYWYEQATMGRSLLTQARAVTGYLQLTVWPAPLVFDHGDYPRDMVMRLGEVWPQFLLVCGLGGATLLALWKRPVVGFLGAWFFVILAPSSSFIPAVTQLRAEHRMYLSLAAVLVGAVMLLQRLAGRATLAVVIGLALVLGGVTWARNRDYRSGLSLWADTAHKRPDNVRARNNHGIELRRSGDLEGAIREFAAAAELAPDYFDARMNLTLLLTERDRTPAGAEQLTVVTKASPVTVNDCNNMSRQSFLRGDLKGAREYLEAAVRIEPTHAPSHNNLGCVLMADRRPDEAIESFRRSIALRPDSMTYFNLGDACEKIGQEAEARAHFIEALRLDPTNRKASERLRKMNGRL